MGNAGSANEHGYIKREESFGSASPRVRHGVNNGDMATKSGYFVGADRMATHPHRADSFQQHQSNNTQQQRHNRSQSLEQGGIHSPSSSSSSNSYMGTDRNCLRQSAQPKFQISGDLTPQQVQLVKRTWKNVMKNINDDEMEIATRLLIRIFQLDPRNLALFDLPNVSPSELRHNPIFIKHVKAFEPTLSHVMNHPSNATSLSKYLQLLGGRHVQNTGVTYKNSSYWKSFVQALIEVVGANNVSMDTYEAFTVLGAFCVEQMRIGYKIEYKLQREAERIARVQIQKRASQSSRK